jgi:transcriptional regulator with XRE-family HTH domain
MRDRIRQFMEYKGVSASDFANLLDVQRSNISHILSGRNLPGAVFIEKLLSTFPELNARWLFLGIGSMISGHEEINLQTSAPSAKVISEPISRVPLSESTMAGRSDGENPRKESIENSGISDRYKNVEKIVILYSDKTFSEYRPE